MRSLFLLSFFCLLGTLVFSQEADLVWDLEQCVAYAAENNLQLQQSELNIQQAEYNKKQAFWAQFPTANASFRHGANFGRSIDLTSYNFVNQTTQSSSLSLSLNQPIFQGLQIRNTLKQSRIDLEASQQDKNQLINDISLQIAQAYLSILLAEENLGVIQAQSNNNKNQYDQTMILIKNGAIPENNRFDLEAQLARDEESIINAQNSVDVAYMNLKVLINLSLDQPLKVKTIDINAFSLEPVDYELDDLFQEALASQANIRAAKLREKSADIGVQIAKGALYPVVSAYAGLNTNFSSAALQNQGFDTSFIALPGEVLTTSDPVLVYVPNISFNQGGVIPYFEQLASNTSANLGINISIPIFNGMRTRLNIKRAELSKRIASLNTEQLEVTLKSNIERSVNDVKAAQKRLNAAQKSLIATRLSVKNTQRRFELGVVNAFELTSVQNTLQSIESNVLQAKYDYIFKQKILDYYRGKTIEINSFR